MRIPESTVQKIYEAAQLEEVVAKFVELKKKGHELLGLCPFHLDTKPSFHVHPQKGIYKCFACGEGGGNAVQFLMKKEGFGYREALEWLAKEYSIEINSVEDPSAPARVALHEKKAKASDWYIEQRNGTFAAFLQTRGITQELADRFGLGYAPDGSPDMLEGRIIFPIQDAWGKPIAFAGRRIGTEKGAKYLNTAEDELYKKREVLYAWHIARSASLRADTVYLLEGYTDVIALHGAGIENATATCGTALTMQQAQLLLRATRDVRLARDGDAAGRKATAERDIPTLLAAGAAPSVIELPSGEDPDSIIREGKNFLDLHAVSWVDFYVRYFEAEHATVNHETGELALTAPRRAQLLRELSDLLLKISDTILREEYAKEVAERCETAFPKVARMADIEIATAMRANTDRKNTWRRRWDEWEADALALGIEDPTADGTLQRSERGYVRVSYRNVAGKQHKVRENRQSVPAIRTTDTYQHTHTPYLPPQMHAERFTSPTPGPLHPIARSYHDEYLEKKGYPTPLFLVRDELTAAVMAAHGLCAIGLPDPQDFSRRNARGELHRLLSQVIEAYQFRQIIYLLPGEAFSLPTPDKGEQRYAETNAAQLGERYRDLLIAFNTALKGLKIESWVAIPPANSTAYAQDDPHWVEKYMRDAISEGRDFFEVENSRLEWHNITYARQEDFEILLYLDSAQRFYDRHTFTQLGQVFRFRGRLAEVDTITGAVSFVTNSEYEPDVREENGHIIGRANGGGWKPIANFTMSCILEVKEDDSYAIYEIKNGATGAIGRAVITDDEFTEKRKFIKSLRRLKRLKASWKGSSDQALEYLEMITQDAPEAESLKRRLGLFHPEGPEATKNERELYVWGNGIMTADGDFRPTDDQGLVTIDGDTYFLPAFSSIQTTDNPEKKFERERKFRYADSGISFEDWLNVFLSVHGQAGHTGFFFYLACLFRDIIVDHYGRFPHLFLLGPKNAGKGTLQESLAALFGDLMVTNLQDDPTPSAYRATFSQYQNAICVLNEMNPSAIPGWMMTGVKGAYDNQTRNRMAGPRTNEIDYGSVTSGLLIMGQEATVYLQEAVNTRFVIEEINRQSFSSDETERYAALRSWEVGDGLTHITADFWSSRKLIREKFAAVITELQRTLKESIPHSSKIDGRLFWNWSVVVAPLIILIRHDRVSYPLDEVEILGHAADRIVQHSENLIGKGVLDILFDFIVSQYQQRSYDLNDNDVWYDVDTNSVNIQLTSLSSKFLRYMNALYRGIENTSKTDLKRRLKNHPGFVPPDNAGDAHKKARLGFQRFPSGLFRMRTEHQDGVTRQRGVPYYSSAYVIDATRLPGELTDTLRAKSVFPWDHFDDDEAPF